LGRMETSRRRRRWGNQGGWRQAEHVGDGGIGRDGEKQNV